MKAGMRKWGMGIVVLVFAVAASAQTPERRAITFKDLISMQRVSDPQISPDSQWIAYSVSTPDLDANHSVRNIWIVPTA